MEVCNIAAADFMPSFFLYRLLFFSNKKLVELENNQKPSSLPWEWRILDSRQAHVVILQGPDVDKAEQRIKSFPEVTKQVPTVLTVSVAATGDGSTQ